MNHPVSLSCLVLTIAALAAGCTDQDDNGRNDRPTARSATVGRGDRLVATLGDSITAGTPRWDPKPAVRASIDRPDRRHQWQHWAAVANPGLRFRNCGVNRERTDEIARRLEQCAESADVLVIQGGINDIAQGRSPREAAENLEEMVAVGKRRGATVVLTEVLPWNAGYPQADIPIRELNKRIHTLARTEGIRVLPFYSTLEDPRKSGRMRADWTDDGSHPSRAGHRRLGEIAFTS